MVETFRSGADASVERAMIARRASETEIDLLTLLSEKVGGLIKTMRIDVLGSEQAKAGPRRGTVKGLDSLTTKFQTQMANIMGILRSAEPRYVRCIKPNAAQAPMISRDLPGLPRPSMAFHGLP